MKFYFIIITTVFSFFTNAQSEIISVSATVLNIQDKQPIAYAHVYVKGRASGTVTDLNGHFVINQVKDVDTISFSFVGFTPVELTVKALKSQDIVFLEPFVESLQEVVLTNNDEFLYDLILKSKSSQTKEKSVAKSYFSLNTQVENKQVELLECYYNAVYQGVDVKEMNLKNGRISSTDNQGRHFVSISSSKAILAHSLFRKNEYFPVSPFELNRQKLQKNYVVHLQSVFRNEENTTYVIKFTPKNNLDWFSGKVWLDSATAVPQKVMLTADKTKVSPFETYIPNDELESVYLSLTKNFSAENGEVRVQSVDFVYGFDYLGRSDKYHVETNAVLYAYAYDTSFVLPYYGVNQSYLSDYRKISAAPYNTFFWDNMNEFKMGDLIERNQKFIKKTVLLNDPNELNQGSYLGFGFYEQPYVPWSEHRMHVIDKLPEGMQYEDYAGVMHSKRYNLKAHLFMDVNKMNGQVHIFTKAIYDPYISFYHFPDSKEGDAFINMYFDIFEIQRRALTKQFNLMDYNVDHFNTLYLEYQRRINELSKKYIKEVQHGEDLDAMKRWNEYIFKNIGLDNLEFYSLE